MNNAARLDVQLAAYIAIVATTIRFVVVPPTSDLRIDGEPTRASGAEAAPPSSPASSPARSLVASNDFRSACPTGKGCDPSLRGLHQRSIDYGHAADVLLITGGAVAAGGLIWRFALPATPSTDGHRTSMLSVTGTY